MYVCICHGVTDASLKSEINRGSDSLRKIMHACGAGSDCGACVKTIKKTLGESKNNARSATHNHSSQGLNTKRQGQIDAFKASSEVALSL